jgi:Hemerythrin HHE cation binding domain
MKFGTTREAPVVGAVAVESVSTGLDEGQGNRSITEILAKDHRRLERLLDLAVAGDGYVERDTYDRFRAGLLRHIGIEEKILLPAAQQRRGGEPLPIAAQLRLEHGAIATLLMPNPTSVVLAALRMILDQHNLLEEGSEGVYHICDTILREDSDQLMVQLRAASDVTVLPCSDAPAVLGAVRRAVQRAGFELPCDFPG